MAPLSNDDLLAVWDRGHARNPVERAVLLLSAGYPGTSLPALAELGVGELDRNVAPTDAVGDGIVVDRDRHGQAG